MFRPICGRRFAERTEVCTKGECDVGRNHESRTVARSVNSTSAFQSCCAACATSSFTINVAFWGTLIYSVWETVGLYKGIVGCTVFIVVMAGVHLIGYRLWQRQFVQDQGPISSAYWPSTKTSLLQQAVVFILALLMLDLGQTMCEAVTAIVAYWLAFSIILVRRPSSPTRGDIFLIRYGFLFIFVCAVAALPFVGRAIDRW